MLRSHPTTRGYSLDSGFLAQVEKLSKMDTAGKDQQAAGALVMNDPRLTQAMAALQGWGLTVTDKEARSSHQDSQAQLQKLTRSCCQNSRTRASSATGKSRYERE